MFILKKKNYFSKQWGLHKKFNKLCFINKYNLYTIYKILYIKYENFTYIINIYILTNNILKFDIISNFFLNKKIKNTNILYTECYKFIFNIKSPKLVLFI